MRKIINGKLYDTDTAKLIEIYHSEEQVNDLYYYKIKLYQKKNKEFFFYCSGNSGTIYKDEKIELCDIDQAKTFIENHGDIETYIELFGEVNE